MQEIIIEQENGLENEKPAKCLHRVVTQNYATVKTQQEQMMKKSDKAAGSNVIKCYKQRVTFAKYM